MNSGEYRRIYVACLAMAEDSKTSDVRARWQAVARACFERAMDRQEKAVKRRGPLGRYSSMHDGVLINCRQAA